MTRPCPTEAEEAAVLVAWLRVKGFKFTHIGNETGHSPEAKRRAVRMKQQGTSKGFPDYIVLVPNTGVLAIELKRQRGSSTSPEQKAWIDAFNDTPGSAATIAKGAQAAIDFIEQYI